MELRHRLAVVAVFVGLIAATVLAFAWEQIGGSVCSASENRPLCETLD